jgi:flagellar FliL protein
MADKKDPKAKDAKPDGAHPEPAAEAAKGGGRKKKLIIIIAAAAVLLLGGGGAAAYVLLGKKKDAHAEADGKKGKAAAKAGHEDDQAAAEDDEEDDADAPPPDQKPKKKKVKRKVFDPAHAPVFVELDPFTVNLADNPETKMMQIKMSLEVHDKDASEALKTLMPLVRNDILLMLGSRFAADMSTREGKEELADEIVANTNGHLKGSKFAKSVVSVQFQHMIIQ